MIDGTQAVTLPSTTLTTASLRQPVTASGATMPDLKIKLIPYAAVPDDLAPPKARGKGVEDSFKVVIPPGGQCGVSLVVDTAVLGKIEELSSESTRALEGVVGKWFMRASPGSPAKLTITPRSSLHSLSPVLNQVVKEGEPVAFLEAIEIRVSWAFPKEGKKRVAGEMLSGEHSLPPNNFEACIENDIDSDDAAEGDTPGQQASSEPSDTPDAADEVMSQLDRGLQAAMRTEWIRYVRASHELTARRFPLVLDGGYADYQSTFCLPRPLYSAIGRFLTTSVRHDTPLYAKCRTLLDGIEAQQDKQVMTSVEAMANLPTRTGPGRKRAKTSLHETSASAAHEGEDKTEKERSERTTAYLAKIKEAEEDTTQGAKLRRTLAQALSSIGYAKFLQVRAGRGKHCANKIEFKGTSDSDSDTEKEATIEEAIERTVQDGPGAETLDSAALWPDPSQLHAPPLTPDYYYDSDEGDDYEDDLDSDLACDMECNGVSWLATPQQGVESAFDMPADCLPGCEGCALSQSDLFPFHDSLAEDVTGLDGLALSPGPVPWMDGPPSPGYFDLDEEVDASAPFELQQKILPPDSYYPYHPDDLDYDPSYDQDHVHDREDLTPDYIDDLDSDDLDTPGEESYGSCEYSHGAGRYGVFSYPEDAKVGYNRLHLGSESFVDDLTEDIDD